MLRWFFGLSLHVRIAIMVAPVLMIGGYGLADLWEKRNTPEVKKEVAMQQLLVEGQCKLSGGTCTLSYDNLRVVMRQPMAKKAGIIRIEIEPNVALRGIKMSLVQAGKEHQIIVERPAGEDIWFAEFPTSLIQPAPDALRIALIRTGKMSYAEVLAPF